ncbi:MAG: KpsF/GutQ family sugar-phosphate isomerase [Phycisphaeraceae bacterium]|nr:KpsF/GutQ family sugar-phosphate isomerase [Phycisphaeraceae bacterium]
MHQASSQPVSKPTADCACAGPSEATAQQQQFAQQVIAAEAQAVSRIVIGVEFHQAVELILGRTTADLKAQVSGTPGSLVVTGLGKSGLIGRKISATFASTGTPSHFLHPTEAMHGDLGRVRRGDVVLAMSYRGNTEEVVSLAALLRQDNIPIIALVGPTSCELASLAEVTLSVGDITEACPMNLAPTASTTAMLAMGDALALSVSRRRNFGVEDYQKVHPGGSLGRLLTPITQAMRFRVGETMVLIPPGLTVQQAYAKAAAVQPTIRQAGALLVTDEQGKLAGIFTDGSLRKLLLKHGTEVWHQSIEQWMSRQPRCLPDTALVRDAVQVARETRFDEIPVVDQEGKPIGLIDVQDLIALKVIEG